MQFHRSSSNPDSLYLKRLFFLFLEQAFEQYFTSSHTFPHFFRQLKGRIQTGQTFVGNPVFFITLGRVIN
jgi:hypothetical protein